MAVTLALAGGAGCAGPAGVEPVGRDPEAQEGAGPAATSTSTSAAAVPPDPAAGGPGFGSQAVPAPAWLGTRPLPLRPDGYGAIQPTPPELQDRRLVTEDLLPPPSGDDFTADVQAVPPAVAARSTWAPACPVALDDLRYVTVAFWGFDGRPHTGELLVDAGAAEGVVEVFRRLHRARFPIEEMRITRTDELDRHPTGDGNNTGAFVCRPSRGATSWSEHAYGRALDINPFHNPYVKGDVVLPELASAYTERSHVRPGMITAGDVVTGAFADLGWAWGGTWRSSRDYMHFSASGR